MMQNTTTFAIVRFVPDPIRGEQINVGLVAIRGDEVASRFVTDLRRLDAFASQDKAFAKKTIRRLEQLFEGRDVQFGEPVVTLQLFERMRHDYRGVVQFSMPGATALAPAEFIEHEYPRLVAPERKRPAERPRVELTRRAQTAVLNAVKHRFGVEELPGNLTIGRTEVAGKFRPHRFHVGVQNGHLYTAAQALAFKGEPADVDRDMGVFAWMFDDVRKTHPDLPLTIVLGKPDPVDRAKQLHEQAKGMFPEYHANVVEE
ncbi:DUF3037 domain-containing protein, partial [bacterium]